MKSNKLTFSLVCLVMLLAIGLVFAPMSIEAHETGELGPAKVKYNPTHPTITLSVPNALPRDEIEAGNTSDNSVINVSSAADIQMLRPNSAGELKIQLASDVLLDIGDFAAADFTLRGFDSDGLPVGTLIADAGITVAHADTNNIDGKHFEVSIDGGDAGIDSATSSNLATLYIILKVATVTNIDPAIHPLAADHPTNQVSNSLKVALVDDPDDSTTTDVDEDVPTVISVMRVPNVTTPVSGPFTLEVVLSEMPEGDVGPGFFTSENGTITKVDAGAPYDLGVDDNNDGDTDDVGESAAETNNPAATGFDDKFYPYYLAVTPEFDVDDPAMVTIKVNDFMDTNQQTCLNKGAEL